MNDIQQLNLDRIGLCRNQKLNAKRSKQIIEGSRLRIGCVNKNK